MGATTSIPDTVDVDEITSTTGEWNKIETHSNNSNVDRFHFLGLSKRQICSLWTRFNELDRDDRGDVKGCKNYLNADDLSRVPKFDENPIAPRLVKVIFDDFGSNGKLTFRQFVNFMSTFGQRERTEHHLRRRSSIKTVTPTSTKTDLESVRYAPEDSSKRRKIKFIFRVRLAQ
jgi:hypothetical protein